MGKLSKALGVAGVAVGATYLSKKENRQKLKKQINKGLNKFNKTDVKSWGKPSDVEDAEMVSEGAMTSVHYYNQLQGKSHGQ
ncbi:hypothetical protein ACFFJI_04340 [Allobacillus sp. GCM10007491]|uniref:YtxH domain-containing protein n=1 Tax=Allobacillus saliphilus TaxID=2912308 RepID=A0A941CWB4_9BACI|nr:hypothetical protein [Allobacillus saliphilus]MBR7554854.1 hypothetical protein [Allobacillus saliphilus]